MARMIPVLSAALLVFLVAKGAHAEKPGFDEKGQFIIGADRLLPVLSYSQAWEGHLGGLPPGESGETTTTSQTSLSFFWGATPPEDTFFTAPRLGLDYVLAPNFTIGGELVVYVTAGGSSSTEHDFVNGQSTTVTQGTTTRTIFGIAPRVGYIFKVNELFSFWLRGGLSFYTEGDHQTVGNNPSYGASQFAVDLEPQVVITPLPHLGVTIGPTFDLPLFGQHWADPNESASSAIFFFGVTAGMVVYF